MTVRDEKHAAARDIEGREVGPLAGKLLAAMVPKHRRKRTLSFGLVKEAAQSQIAAGERNQLWICVGGCRRANRGEGQPGKNNHHDPCAARPRPGRRRTLIHSTKDNSGQPRTAEKRKLAAVQCSRFPMAKGV